MAVRAFLAAMTLAAAACADTGGATQARDGDPAMYATEVQPIVARRCAFLGCHGREGMPLTTYALNYLRLRDPDGDVDPSRPSLDERELSQAEIDYNRLALAARVGPDDPAGDRERLLRRLIPEGEGGIPHADVAVYERADDPELAVLRRFLETVQ